MENNKYDQIFEDSENATQMHMLKKSLHNCGEIPSKTLLKIMFFKLKSFDFVEQKFNHHHPDRRILFDKVKRGRKYKTGLTLSNKHKKLIKNRIFYSLNKKFGVQQCQTLMNIDIDIDIDILSNTTTHNKLMRSDLSKFLGIVEHCQTK